MTTKTRETLEDRAARVAAELAAIREEESKHQQAELERLAQHHASFDAAIVADYDRAALDAEVEAARQALHQVIAEHPLTQALKGYYFAASRRREVVDQHFAALARQGRDISGVQRPSADDIGVPDVLDVMEKTAKTAAAEWRTQAEADFHRRRDTVTEEPTT